MDLKLIVIAVVSLVLGFLLASSLRPEVGVGPSEAERILEQLQREIIPAEGSPTGYGITFSEAGYLTLVAKNRTLSVPPERAEDFEGLNMRLPCCPFRSPSVDEAKNCPCEHHQALYGLAKWLLQEDYPADRVQEEVTRWSRYLFPKEALRAEMERRAKLDPTVEAALEELKAKGKC
jgi:hypothetical protein